MPKSEVLVLQTRLASFNLVVLANEDVGRQVAVLGRYERRDSRFMQSHIRDNDICFDVGANVGYYSILMAKAASAGRVYAFEPVPINYHIICLNALLNDCSHIVVSQFAVGARECAVDFSQSTDGAFSSLIPVGRKKEACSFKTRMRTLDAFVAENKLGKIDIMKVDVEGAEMLVIEGGRDLLRNASARPRVILMELYDPNLKPYDTSVTAVIQAMCEFGYSPFIVNRRDDPLPFMPCHHNIHQNIFFMAQSGKGR
jgi:FkbM family methyltransferase